MSLTKPNPASSVDATNERLKSLIERIERLETEKKEVADGIKDVFAEARSAGFEPSVMREVIRLRRLETDERQERETLLDTYMRAMGMT